jgi:hypothetical protein
MKKIIILYELDFLILDIKENLGNFFVKKPQIKIFAFSKIVDYFSINNHFQNHLYIIGTNQLKK